MSLVTLAEAQAWVRVSDPTATGLLPFAIQVASRAVEAYCSRGFVLQDRVEDYDGTGTGRMLLNTWPVQDVTAISINEVAVPRSVNRSAGFVVHDRQISLFGRIFDRGSRNVRVTYLAGYYPIPDDVKLATLFATQAVINARSTDPNVMSESAGGVYSASYGPFGPGALPLNARQLLEPYRSRWSS